MKKNPDCLACDKYGPPEWDTAARDWVHRIPYAYVGGPDKPIKCPASVIDGHWQHGKRLDQ